MYTCECSAIYSMYVTLKDSYRVSVAATQYVKACNDLCKVACGVSGTREMQATSHLPFSAGKECSPTQTPGTRECAKYVCR